MSPLCGLKQSSEPLSQNNKRLCSNKLKSGFENTQVFADDGYSGVNFERPAFRRMLHLISLSENSKNKKKKRNCEEIRFKTSFFAAPLLFMYKSDLIFSTDIPLYGNYQNNTKIGVSQCVVHLDFMRIFRNT